MPLLRALCLVHEMPGGAEIVRCAPFSFRFTVQELSVRMPDNQERTFDAGARQLLAAQFQNLQAQSACVIVPLTSGSRQRLSDSVSVFLKRLLIPLRDDFGDRIRTVFVLGLDSFCDLANSKELLREIAALSPVICPSVTALLVANRYYPDMHNPKIAGTSEDIEVAVTALTTALLSCSDDDLLSDLIAPGEYRNKRVARSCRFTVLGDGSEKARSAAHAAWQDVVLASVCAAGMSEEIRDFADATAAESFSSLETGISGKFTCAAVEPPMVDEAADPAWRTGDVGKVSAKLSTLIAKKAEEFNTLRKKAELRFLEDFHRDLETIVRRSLSDAGEKLRNKAPNMQCLQSWIGTLLGKSQAVYNERLKDWRALMAQALEPQAAALDIEALRKRILTVIAKRPRMGFIWLLTGVLCALLGFLCALGFHSTSWSGWLGSLAGGMVVAVVAGIIAWFMIKARVVIPWELEFAAAVGDINAQLKQWSDQQKAAIDDLMKIKRAVALMRAIEMLTSSGNEALQKVDRLSKAMQQLRDDRGTYWSSFVTNTSVTLGTGLFHSVSSVAVFDDWKSKIKRIAESKLAASVFWDCAGSALLECLTGKQDPSSAMDRIAEVLRNKSKIETQDQNFEDPAWVSMARGTGYFAPDVFDHGFGVDSLSLTDLSSFVTQQQGSFKKVVFIPGVPDDNTRARYENNGWKIVSPAASHISFLWTDRWFEMDDWVSRFEGMPWPKK